MTHGIGEEMSKNHAKSTPCLQASWDGTPAAAEGTDSAAQLELLSNAEGELRVSFDAHMKYLSEVRETLVCRPRNKKKVYVDYGVIPFPVQ